MEGSAKELLEGTTKRHHDYLSIVVVLHCLVDVVYFSCKHIKLRDDEFLSEGLDQQHNVSTDTPERT